MFHINLQFHSASLHFRVYFTSGCRFLPMSVFCKPPCLHHRASLSDGDVSRRTAGSHLEPCRQRRDQRRRHRGPQLHSLKLTWTRVKWRGLHQLVLQVTGSIRALGTPHAVTQGTPRGKFRDSSEGLCFLFSNRVRWNMVEL